MTAAMTMEQQRSLARSLDRAARCGTWKVEAARLYRGTLFVEERLMTAHGDCSIHLAADSAGRYRQIESRQWWDWIERRGEMVPLPYARGGRS